MFRKDNEIPTQSILLKLTTVTGIMEFNTKHINTECIQHLWWCKSKSDKTGIQWLLSAETKQQSNKTEKHEAEVGVYECSCGTSCAVEVPVFTLLWSIKNKNWRNNLIPGFVT